MQKEQLAIIWRWLFIVLCLVAIAIANYFASANEIFLKTTQVFLVLAIAYCFFFQSRKTGNVSTNGNYDLSSHIDLQEPIRNPIVIIYYGIITAACILIASKAANTGVNPFEFLGINFIFFGVLILFAPFIIWIERKRYIQAGQT